MDCQADASTSINVSRDEICCNSQAVKGLWMGRMVDRAALILATSKIVAEKNGTTSVSSSRFAFSRRIADPNGPSKVDAGRD
jgi:hypothetical protein